MACDRDVGMWVNCGEGAVFSMKCRACHRFARFVASSLVSTAVDQTMAFVLFQSLETLMGDVSYPRVLLATFIARVSAITLNYLINLRFVFVEDPCLREGEGAGGATAEVTAGGTALRDQRESLPRFLVLASTIMLLSSIGVYAAHVYMGVDESMAKLVVDFLLFFVNYTVQRTWVFVRPA